MAHLLSRENCHPKAGQTFTVDREKYVLGGPLGDGATSLVRKATRLSDNANRAVKFLAPDPKYIDESVFDDVAGRFRREGERGAQLNHEHLISIYDYCENGGNMFCDAGAPSNPFLLMEQMQGKTLESFIKHSRTDQNIFEVTRKKLFIAIQITNAIRELHKQKLIHRDIKPGNIFLSRVLNVDEFPFVKLGDFGIVKWGDFHSSLSTGVLTATNQKGLGTMKYMSPEQAISPKEVTYSSDIYSLGITLYELFTSQILASPHHVYQVRDARLLRGTTASRLLSMQCRIKGDDEPIAALILDMHLRGIKGRPRVDKICGQLEVLYERRYEVEWQNDLI